MIVETLRQKALPALIGLAVALSVMMPAIAFADEEPQPSEAFESMLVDLQAQAQAQAQPDLPTAAVLDHCETFAQQANSMLLVEQALSLKGSPYAYGGTTPRGFDCSGFTQYCFRNALGIELPRTAAAQAALGESVSMDELQPGDLLFWGSGSGVYHVGIYVEDGTYIHAAGSGKGVRVQTMDYFHPTFAKRVC
ncbi:C40 family peptidase [Anaerotardibacter muris]|uniref:C40 family peptidase n=1 Tax=Anaerotardibacter muris TaxID=2941505 RepID=UPI00203C773C|nr:C40 family peptidase [Anaerotardibacter muris]